MIKVEGGDIEVKEEGMTKKKRTVRKKKIYGSPMSILK